MFLFAGENCTDVHLARLIASVKKAGLDVHDMFLANQCSVTSEVVLQRNGQADSTYSFSHVDGSSRCRISGWAMELVIGHESSLAPSNRLHSQSLTPASSSRGRLARRMEQRACGKILCSPAVIGVCAG